MSTPMTTPLNTHSLRAALRALPESEWRQFILLNFQVAYKQLTSGMDRTTQENVLFERIPFSEISEAWTKRLIALPGKMVIDDAVHCLEREARKAIIFIGPMFFGKTSKLHELDRWFTTRGETATDARPHVRRHVVWTQLCELQENARTSPESFAKFFLRSWEKAFDTCQPFVASSSDPFASMWAWLGDSIRLTGTDEWLWIVDDLHLASELRFGRDFFGTLRARIDACYDPIWGRLRWAFASQIPDLDAQNANSPLDNVLLRLSLTVVTPDEADWMAKTWGVTCSERNLEQLRQHLGGYPYLMNAALSEARGMPLQKVLDQIKKTPFDSPIGDALERLLCRVVQDDQWLSILRDVVERPRFRLSSREHERHLQALGLIRWNRSRGFELGCPAFVALLDAVRS